jgi:Pyruvate/2-oxoacid:ferredoxin oxidoreductase delta subunit
MKRMQRNFDDWRAAAVAAQQYSATNTQACVYCPTNMVYPQHTIELRIRKQLYISCGCFVVA